MNEYYKDYTALYDFLEKLDINVNAENLGLVIRNLIAVAPQLIKLDEIREFFTVECETQLNELASIYTGPFKSLSKRILDKELYSLLVHLPEYKMTKKVICLAALFIYSQLNTNLLTGHTASPNVKTNRARLRIFIEKVSKDVISLHEYIKDEKGIVDAERLLKNVVVNNKIEEHCKTAILLGNIYKAIIGNNNFSTMNKKKTGPAEPKQPVKSHPHTFKPTSGGSGKIPHTGDISDIFNFSKTCYTEKPDLEASSSISYVIYETPETTIINKNEANRYSQVKSSIENNYPQNHQRVLKNKEAKVFYKKLLCQFEMVDGIEQKKSILGMIFILLIGLDDTWLHDIMIIDEINDYHQLNKGKILVSTSGYIQFYQIELPHIYHPQKKEFNYLKSHKNQIVTLPLPLSIIPILFEIKASMVSSEFKIDKKIYDEEFTKMRGKLKKRFKNDKLREFSFNLYYRESGEDEVYATFLKPVSPYLIPSSCYYASANLKVLETIHTTSFTKVFGECAPPIESNSDRYIGSKLCIDITKIKQWLLTLKLDIESNIRGNRTPTELVSTHNNYVLYVSTVLLITTGHRPVNDIFDNRNHLFIDDGFALIGDKAVGKNHDLRMVTLCKTAKQQINFYQEHLKNMSNRISKFDIDTAGKLKALIEPNQKQSLPFLLLLNIDKNDEIKTTGVCKKSIENYWSDLGLPANFYRHFMCDALKKNNVKREIVNFYMGHFSSGQNLLSPFSPIKPKLMIEKLSTEIERVVNKLNLQAVKGMSDTKHYASKLNKCINAPLIFPKKSLFGISKRLETRSSKVQTAKELAMEYLEKIHPTFYLKTKKELSDIALDKMKDYAMSESNGLKSLILNEFNTAIKKRARLSHRKPERLFFLKSGYEKSILTNDSALRAQQYLVFREIILRVAIDSVALQKSNKKKCVDKLVWIYLHCLSKDLPYFLSIAEFHHLIKQECNFINDALCYESTFKNHGLVRYFPNSQSALLIRKLKLNLSKSAPSKQTISIAEKNIMANLHKKDDLIPKTLEKLKKVIKIGWLFNDSPIFHAYRNKEVYLPLPSYIRVLEKNNE